MTSLEAHNPFVETSKVRANSTNGVHAKRHLRRFLLAFVCAALPLCAEEPDFGNIHIPRVNEPPRIEDFLNMEASAAWQQKLAKVEQFRQRIPSDGAPGSEKTDVYLGYDAKNLYVIFVCFDK